MRAALNQANAICAKASTERRLMTAEEFGKVAKTLFWRIVVAPYVASYDGVIQTPEITKKAEEVACTVGKIIQIGHFAFKSKTAAGLDLADEPHKPAVGQFVFHEPYAGIEVKLKGGRNVRILNETDILLVVDDPDQIAGYLN